jgi:hypothetical protein
MVQLGSLAVSRSFVLNGRLDSDILMYRHGRTKAPLVDSILVSKYAQKVKRSRLVAVELHPAHRDPQLSTTSKLDLAPHHVPSSRSLS